MVPRVYAALAARLSALAGRLALIIAPDECAQVIDLGLHLTHALDVDVHFTSKMLDRLGEMCERRFERSDSGAVAFGGFAIGGATDGHRADVEFTSPA